MNVGDLFLSRLEEEREAFTREDVFLPSRLPAFKSWSDLLGENEHALNRRSSAARSIRKRVRTFLADIYATLGLEVLVLSTLTISMTNLSRVDIRTMLPNPRRWWVNVSHPQSLTDFSAALAEEYDIPNLTAILPQRTQEIQASEPLAASNIGHNSGIQNTSLPGLCLPQ